MDKVKVIYDDEIEVNGHVTAVSTTHWDTHRETRLEFRHDLQIPPRRSYKFFHKGRTIDLREITTPFGLLDEETQAALKAHDGPYEMYCQTGWVRWSPSWDRSRSYRVKRAPKVETVTGKGHAYSSSMYGWLVLGRNTGEHPNTVQGKTTTTLKNGKPVKIVWEIDQ